MSFIKPDGFVTDEFAQAVVKLAAAYPAQRTLEETTIWVYARALSDCTIEQVLHACGCAIRECKFFPSVAELRSYITAPVEEAALHAWDDFRRAAGEIGAYASVDLEDQAAASALLRVFGSWPAYCQQATDGNGGWIARRTEFVAAYRDACRMGMRGQSRWMRLAGLCESKHANFKLGPVAWRGLITAKGVVRMQRDIPRLKAHDEKRTPIALSAGLDQGGAGPSDDSR